MPQRRCLSIDHPGVGASPSRGAQSIDEIADAVVELLDLMDIDRCAVIGHSTGGLVVQALALDHADRVSAIVLSSTWAKPDKRFRDLFRLRQHVLMTGGGAAYSALGQLLAYPAEWYEKNIARTEELALDRSSADLVDVALVFERIDMLLEYSRASELGGITVPTLVVGASDDNIVPYLHSVDLRRRIPASRLAELSGGHFTPVTRVHDYVSLVTQFLDECLF